MEKNEKMNEQTEVREDVVVETVETEVATDSGVETTESTEIRVAVEDRLETTGSVAANAESGAPEHREPTVDEGETVECAEATETEMGRDDDSEEAGVAELVERARQEGYESGYSRGYEEARGKSIDEWMHESIDDAGEVWDYGGESEVMILNNIRPSIWE